jgi:hypothetical protein
MKKIKNLCITLVIIQFRNENSYILYAIKLYTNKIILLCPTYTRNIIFNHSYLVRIFEVRIQV